MVLDMAGFTPLRVPAWVSVPAGALNHTAVMRDRSALLLRSCSTTPLAEQLSALRKDDAVLQFELSQEPNAENYIGKAFSAGLFRQGGYKKRTAEHPAWLAGLAAAAEVLTEARGALMSEAAVAFLRAKQGVLLRLHGLFGKAVYVPHFFVQYDFLGEDAPLQARSPAQAATYLLTQRPPQRPVGCDLLTYPLCELPQ